MNMGVALAARQDPLEGHAQGVNIVTRFRLFGWVALSCAAQLRIQEVFSATRLRLRSLAAGMPLVCEQLKVCQDGLEVVRA